MLRDVLHDRSRRGSRGVEVSRRRNNDKGDRVGHPFYRCYSLASALEVDLAKELECLIVTVTHVFVPPGVCTKTPR